MNRYDHVVPFTTIRGLPRPRAVYYLLLTVSGGYPGPELSTTFYWLYQGATRHRAIYYLLLTVSGGYPRPRAVYYLLLTVSGGYPAQSCLLPSIDCIRGLPGPELHSLSLIGCHRPSSVNLISLQSVSFRKISVNKLKAKKKKTLLVAFCWFAKNFL